MSKLTPQIAAMYAINTWVTVKPLRQNSPEGKFLLDFRLLELFALGEVELKLHLRRLEDMTEEEAIHIGELVIGSYDSVKFRVDRHESVSGQFRYWKVHKEHRGYGKSLTIDDLGEIDVYDKHDEGSHVIYMKQHYVTAYLLSKSFDLFGLIDSGAAIDAKTLASKDTQGK